MNSRRSAAANPVSFIGGTQDLSHEDTVEGILASLQLRYGLTARETRGQIETIRRDPSLPLQEHASKMQKLAGIAYAGLPAAHRLQMTRERPLASLNNLGLQKHLLGVPTPDMEAMVIVGNGYLQLTTTHAAAGPIRLLTRPQRPLRQEIDSRP